MARDLALLDRARATGECVFSVYSWERPTLSLGRNQAARHAYDRDRLAELGIDVIRRPTGGRALLHHREVTYSVTAPVEECESLRASYDRVNRLLLHGLSQLGVHVTAAGDSATAVPPVGLPCFAEPSAGELVANGRKLAGSAQWREVDAFLQHGSILVENDQGIFGRIGRSELSRRLAAPATLLELLGRAPSIGEVAESLFAAVRELEDPGATRMDESEIRAAALTRAHALQNEVWTWRR